MDCTFYVAESIKPTLRTMRLQEAHVTWSHLVLQEGTIHISKSYFLNQVLGMHSKTYVKFEQELYPLS